MTQLKKIWLHLLFLNSLLVFVTPSAQSKLAPMNDEELKLLKSMRITPATSWLVAQNFTGKLADEKNVNLNDYSGRFVLLNFWATWCSPCLKEMPDFEEAYREIGKDKLVVLAVGMGEDTKKISKFIEKYGFSFPLLADPNLVISNLYGVKNIPVTYLIDPKGLVLGRALGIREWARPDFLAFINSRLK